MSTDADKALLESISGLTPETLRFARQQWTKTHDMRRIINAEADRLKESLRNSLESCTPEDLKTLQGQITGIKAFLGAINAQGEK